MYGHLIALVATFLLVHRLRKGALWKDPILLRFPATVTLYMFIISLPLLFGFDDDIHTPYSLFYCLLNPLSFAMDTDGLELALWGNPYSAPPNLMFGVVSIVIWAILSFIIALAIFGYRKMYNAKMKATGL